MPRNKKPRKPHRPAHRAPGTLPIVFRHARSAELDLALAPQLSLHNILQGSGEEADLHTVVAQINLGRVIAERSDADGYVFTDDARAIAIAGVDAVRALRQRWQRTGRVGVTGDEFRAIGAALNQADELELHHSTRRQLRDESALMARLAHEQREHRSAA